MAFKALFFEEKPQFRASGSRVWRRLANAGPGAPFLFFLAAAVSGRRTWMFSPWFAEMRRGATNYSVEC